MAVPNLLLVRPAGSTGNFTPIKAPSQMTWRVQDISAPDAGRTLDGVMHKERLALPGGQKRKLELSWNVVIFGEESRTILQAFTPEYVELMYPDPQEGAVVTKTFYTGDKELKFRVWLDDRQYLTEMAFNLIEQ